MEKIGLAGGGASEVVGAFAVVGEVEPFALGFGRRPQTDDEMAGADTAAARMIADEPW